MKQTLDKLTDVIEEALPKEQNYALITFPDGDGRVDIVTNIVDKDILLKRLQMFIFKALKEETFETPDNEKT